MIESRISLLTREVIPFYLSLALLGAAVLAVDMGLHLAGLVWIGRYLGIAGVVLIMGSSVYSLRKRKLIRWGRPAALLSWHEGLAWAGSLLILVHAGIHFNAVLAWLAVFAMLINIASGLTGKYLLGRVRKRLDETRTRLRSQGLSAGELDEKTLWDSLTVDMVRQWRVVHLPITLAFAALALAHIIATFLFWGWK